MLSAEPVGRKQTKPPVPPPAGLRLNVGLHRYRVMIGKLIVRQYSTLSQAYDALLVFPNATIVDITTRNVIVTKGDWPGMIQ